MCDHIWRCARAAVAYLWRGVVVLLQSILYLKISPLELAACLHMVDASTQVSYPGNGPKPATVLLAMLCLTLATTRWHVPRHIACFSAALCQLCACSASMLTTHVSQWHFSFRRSGKELADKKRAAAISELLQSPRRGQQQARNHIMLPLNPMLLQSTSCLRRSDRRASYLQAVTT